MFLYIYRRRTGFDCEYKCEMRVFVGFTICKTRSMVPYNVAIYRIAKNFHVFKISRIYENIHVEFHEPTSADCQSGILWAGPYYMKICRLHFCGRR